MASSQQGRPSSQGPGGMMPPPQMAQPTSGSFYGAFEECDRQARQRKYQIAELEDKIEHVEKTRKQSQEIIAKLRTDIAKYQVEAKAAEMTYQNKLKEKQLMENLFRALSKEMDRVAEDLGRKKSRVQELKLFRQQKIDYLRKAEEKFIHQCRQSPKIAKVIEAKEKADALEDIVYEKRQDFELRKVQYLELKKKHAEAWEAFKKTCVKMAEIYVGCQKKKKELQLLRSEYEKTFRTAGVSSISTRQSQTSRQVQKPLQAPPSVAGASRSTFLKPTTPSRMDGFGTRLGVATFIQRRSYTFQQLDRMCQTNVVSDKAADRRSFDLGDRTRTFLSSGSSMPNESLVIQIRSKLKGTVQPMPRNQESRNVNTATIASSSGATVVPQARQERDVQPPMVDLCTPSPPRSNLGERSSHQMQEQMEVTEDVGKEHPEKEKIHDLSDSETHQEIAAPATADHVEDQPQSAFKDGRLQMPTQPTGFMFSTTCDEASNSPAKSPPEGSSFANIFGGMSSVEPSTSNVSGGFNLFGGDPFSSGSTPTTAQTETNFNFLLF